VGFRAFFENMFYSPGITHKVISILLSPISVLYGSLMMFRRFAAKPHLYDVPIISVGNIVMGGSGKTPFVIEIASRYKDVTIVSRGYGRKSEGLIEVSRRGRVLCDVRQSGDEAMLMAKNLPDASVIVSENRPKAIERAIELSAKLIILDDGFSRVEIEKFDIVLEPAFVPNRMPIPAGPYREFPFAARYCDLLLKEGVDYRRVVDIVEPEDKMVLVTAIANPDRLEPYLPDSVVARYHLPDHSWFDKSEMESIMRKHGAQSILVTEKDLVKLEGFKLPLSVMRLQLQIDNSVMDTIDKYIKERYAS